MLPLSGLKVIELGQNIAGPYAGSILAMFGADVIKIERPDGGDDARGWGPPFLEGASGTYHALNVNKTSVALDLKDAAHVAWLKAQITEADVLVQNLRAGVMEELGLGREALGQLNDRLVYCAISAFGIKGPMRLNPGYEPMVQAFGGLFALNGEEERPGVRIGVQALDMGTGMWTALGCLLGLQQRQRTGKGCVVDTSLFETALAWQTVAHSGYRLSGTIPRRHASGSNAVVPFQAFDTRDGRLVVAAANDRLFAKLAQVLGAPEWAADPRFKTNGDRAGHKDALLGLIGAVLAREPSATWLERLEAAGVPCAPIQDMAQVMAHPQTAATGMVLPVPGLDHHVIGMPVSIDGARPAIRTPAPGLGAGNAGLGLGSARKKA